MSPFEGANHVEIYGGIITGGTVADAIGIRPFLTHVGRWRFFVDVVEHGEGRICMWDGASYDDAIRVADEISQEWEAAEVVDLVGGEPGANPDR